MKEQSEIIAGLDMGLDNGVLAEMADVEWCKMRDAKATANGQENQETAANKS